MTSSSSGVSAERPTQFGGSAWRQVTRRAAQQVGKDHLSMISSGVAFRFFLALFPAIAAAVSIYGMVADPGDVQRAVESVRGILPAQVADLVGGQMADVAANSGAALGLGALAGVVVALWSANGGTKGLIEALDIAYDEEEKRGFFRLNMISLLLTVGAMLALIVAVMVVVVLPAVLGRLPLPETVKTVVSWSRWPILAVAMMLGLAVFYRYAPSRDAPRWQWVSIGAVVATVLWLVASGLFSWYASNAGSYDATYGSLAAIVILLLWFYISAFVVLFGAELNSEMERQTARDTTVGEPAPLGRRAAYAADTVAAKEYQGGHGGERPARWQPRRERPSPRGRGEAGQLEAQIDETRRRMDETLRELGHRFTPGEVFEGTAAALRRDVERIGAGDRRPVLLGALGLAVGALVAAALPGERKGPARGSSETLH